MKENIFKYRNGKFIISEGYGSIKEVEPDKKSKEKIDNNSVLGLLKSFNFSLKDAKSVIEAVKSWSQKNNVRLSKKIDTGIESYEEIGEEPKNIDDKDSDVSTSSDIVKPDTPETPPINTDKTEELPSSEEEPELEKEKNITGDSEKISTISNTSEEQFNNIGEDMDKQTNKSLQFNIMRMITELVKDPDRQISNEDMQEHLFTSVGVSKQEFSNAIGKIHNTYYKLINDMQNFANIEFDTKLSRKQLENLYIALEELIIANNQEKEEKFKLTTVSKPSWSSSGERIKPDVGSKSLNLGDVSPEDLLRMSQQRKNANR